MKRCHRNRGMTLMEVTLAATLTIIVMSTSLAVCIYGLTGFFKASAKVDAESTSQISLRRIAIELREAVSVTVDSNGMGLTYVKGATDSSGNLTIPIVSDGVTRRIYLSGTNILISAGTSSRTLVRNVITTDPLNSNASYTIFSGNGTGIVRFINAMLVTQSTSSTYGTYTSRSRETIYFRNVPESIR